MRIPLVCATLVAGICSLIISLPSAEAQTRPPLGGVGAPSGLGGAPAGAPAMTSPAPSGGGSPVAVIDLGFIFKNHIRFKQSMDDLKKDADQFEGWLRQQRETAQKLQENIKIYKPGTPDYKKTEEDMARMQSEVQVQMTLKKKELMEREAKTYYSIYNEVVAEVTEFSIRNGVSLVIRYTRDPIDKDNASSVLQGVNRPVVFQRNLDITDIVLKRINERTGPAVTPNPNPAPLGVNGNGPVDRNAVRPVVPGPRDTLPR